VAQGGRAATFGLPAVAVSRRGRPRAWPLWSALARPSPALIDWSLAGGLAALAVIQLGLFTSLDGLVPLQVAAGFLLTLLQTVPIGFRRRAHLAVLLLTGCAALTQLLLDIPSSDFGTYGVAVAFYTVQAMSDRRLANSMAAAAAVGILGANLLDDFRQAHVVDVIVTYAQFTVAWALGLSARYRRQHIADLEDRAARTERETEYRRREAVAEERARIGRELHDVINHSLCVMLVQAGAARGVVERQPASAQACLSSIEAVGREALTEVRRVLVLMREEEGLNGDDRPGLHRLPQLVAQFAAAGLAVRVETAGEPRPLPAAMDLSAYRILQEALTNTLRHAGPVGVGVSIRHHAEGVDLEVVDDGPAAGRPAVPAAGPGHGLIGMRERTRLFGGQLTAGQDGRGFAVEATLRFGVGER